MGKSVDSFAERRPYIFDKASDEKYLNNDDLGQDPSTTTYAIKLGISKHCRTGTTYTPIKAVSATYEQDPLLASPAFSMAKSSATRVSTYSKTSSTRPTNDFQLYQSLELP